MSPAGPASSASPRRPSRCFPTRACWCCPRICPAASSAARQLDAAARGDYDLLIGTQLVAKGHNFPLLTLVGDRRRRRRARQRRSARRRAHVPAAASGDRPRRTRRQAGPRAAADLSARAPRHRRAVVGRRRAFLSRRDRAAPARRPAALWPPRGDDRLRRGSRRGGGARAGPRARRACAARGPTGALAPIGGFARRTKSRCSARPRRRSRCCAAGIVSASPSRRRAPPTCRASCAPCWRPRRRRAAACGSPSTSIRRVFSEAPRGVAAVITLSYW